MHSDRGVGGISLMKRSGMIVVLNKVLNKDLGLRVFITKPQWPCHCPDCAGQFSGQLESSKLKYRFGAHIKHEKTNNFLGPV